MIEGRFPRPVGAIGNAATFSFPVMHHVVSGASGEKTVRELSNLKPGSNAYMDAISPWLEGARLLEEQGCKALTTSCGFAVLFQKELAETVEIPVWSSSLMMASFILSGLGPDKALGVISAEKTSLGPAHLGAAGILLDRVRIAGMEGCPEFAATTWDDRETLDQDRLEDEALSVAKRLIADHPEIGAILLECSLLPPYRAAIQAATGKPVFDFTHLVEMAHNATTINEYP